MELTRPQSVKDVRKLVDAQGIEFLFCQFVEMYGKPNAKLVPTTHLEDAFADGAGFAGFAAGEIGQGPHSPDLAAMPDPASYTPVPWQPNLARVACDVYVEGEPSPYCPRTILRRQLARAADKGYVFKIGMEAEFLLLRKGDDGKLVVADALDDLDRPCYDMKALTRNYEFMSTLSSYQTQLGWDNYANDHEDANGQFESNFTYTDALTFADRVIFFRYMVHSMAQERGLLATFMPKPFSNLTGNGLPHAHEPVGRREGREPVRGRERPARLRPVAPGLQLPGRPAEARQGVHRDHRADRELVQAADHRRADVGRDVGAGVRHVRRATTGRR